jgi:hypothetical protein
VQQISELAPRQQTNFIRIPNSQERIAHRTHILPVTIQSIYKTMSLTNCFTLRAILLALASLAAITSAYSLENDDQHPLHADRNSNFSVGFSLQSFYTTATVIFEGVDGTLETHTRTYSPGYLYDQVMTKFVAEIFATPCVYITFSSTIYSELIKYFSGRRTITMESTGPTCPGRVHAWPSSLWGSRLHMRLAFSLKPFNIYDPS